MARYISVTETAKLVRQSLKENFKGTKFSVRSSSYAGGASIDVTWTDGPCDPDVSSIVKRFQGASFDSMTDSTSYHTSTLNGEDVHFGSDYVMCHRKFSWLFIECIAAQFCKYYGIATDAIKIVGSNTDAFVNTDKLDYSQKHWFSDILRNTDAKNMYRAYDADDEREDRRQAEYEAKAKAEREAKEREQSEFARLAQEQAKQQAEEKARRERQQQDEQARRQKEQQRRANSAARKPSVLATKASALAYLGLPLNASRPAILAAFRAKVKASADGKGGYIGDMDLLVKAKEKSLQS